MNTAADLCASAYQRLIQESTIAGEIDEGYLGADDAGGPWASGWIFQGVYDIRPFRDVEGTGKGAIVMRSVDTWGANAHNTAKFPILQALIWSDSSRAADGSTLARDGQARAGRLARVVDELFHDPGNVNHDWPEGLYVTSCRRTSGPDYMEVPDSDGVWRAELRYEVIIG